jgi:hypothetical protein
MPLKYGLRRKARRTSKQQLAGMFNGLWEHGPLFTGPAACHYAPRSMRHCMAMQKSQHVKHLIRKCWSRAREIVRRTHTPTVSAN